MKKFWNFANVADSNNRTLRLEGAIAEESWFDDEVTPKAFRDELFSGNGDVEIFLNSPGGDCFAASQIYTMLCEYSGKVTIKIDGIAASAASVIAMAGDEVYMSPTAMMMIHNPMTVAFGNHEDMEKAIAMLDEVKNSIINAYENKTGMSRTKISHMMDDETWMSARKAHELGFIDGVLYENEGEEHNTGGFEFSNCVAMDNLREKLMAKFKTVDEPRDDETGVSVAYLEKRLNLLNI